jgi:hypothetical protein
MIEEIAHEGQERNQLQLHNYNSCKYRYEYSYKFELSFNTLRHENENEKEGSTSQFEVELELDYLELDEYLKPSRSRLPPRSNSRVQLFPQEERRRSLDEH